MSVWKVQIVDLTAFYVFLLSSIVSREELKCLQGIRHTEGVVALRMYVKPDTTEDQQMLPQFSESLQ